MTVQKLMAMIPRILPATGLLAVTGLLAFHIPAYAQAGSKLAGVSGDLPLLAVVGIGIVLGGVVSAIRTRKQ